MSVRMAEARSCAHNEDPRDRLRAADRYGVRPRSLQQWIYQAGLGPAAERLYWELWDEGSLRGDYLVTVPVAELAHRICVTESTANRAMRQLLERGLIRRTRQAKLADSPFREPVALTEVRLPLEVVRGLASLRPRRARSASGSEGAREQATNSVVEACNPQAGAIASPRAGTSSQDSLVPPQLISRLVCRGKLSAAERDAWIAWKKGEAPEFEFRAGNPLSEEERASVLAAQLIERSNKRPTATRPAQAATALNSTQRKQLDYFSAQRLRQRIGQLVPLEDVERRFHEITWSIQNGSLSKKATLLHSVNLGLKLLREGAWTTPNRMPTSWRFRPQEARA